VEGVFWVSMQVVARGLKSIMKNERLPRGTVSVSVKEAAEKRRVIRCVHLAHVFAARVLYMHWV
jgi:hypothetical protein